MARQIYYDPFGQRLGGYRMGVQDEVSLQDQTRRARASDYDFDYLQPLRTQGLAREEAYQQFADPYRRNAAPIAQRGAQAQLYGIEQPIMRQIGQTTGDYAGAQTGDIGFQRGIYGMESPEERGAAIDTNRYINEQPTARVDDYNSFIGQIAQEYGVDPAQLMQAVAPYLLRGVGGRGDNQFPTYTEQAYDFDQLYPRTIQNAQLNAGYGQQEWQRGYQEDQLRRQYDYNDVIRQQNLSRYGLPPEGGESIIDDGY